MYNNENNILLGRRKNNHIIPLNDPKRKLVGKTILFTNARDENNIKGSGSGYLTMEDEFLVLNAFNHVRHMLGYYLFADSLAINWLMFGTNNHRKEPAEGLIIENYTKSELKIDKHVKTFVRPSQVEDAITPHYFVLSNPQRMVSINMKPMSNTKSFNEWDIEYTKCPAFIAHYVYQSEESYIKRKINLPRDDNSLYRKIESNIHAKHNSTVNELVKTKYADPINKILNI